MGRLISACAAGCAMFVGVCATTSAAATTLRLGCATSHKPATLDLSTGVVTPTLRGPGGVGPYAVVVTALPVGWVPNQGGAEWVGPTSDGDESAPGGVYVYRIKVSSGKCATPGTVTLSGFIAGDNKAKLLLDGNLLASTVNYPYGYSAPNPVAFTNLPFPSTGRHALKIVVKNQALYTGALLRAVLTRTVP